MTIDQARLAARAKARADARAAVDLIVAGVSGLGDEARLTFWDEVRAELDERCSESRPPVVQAEPAAVVPMGDEEARRFERTPMPFGKHRGTPVADTPAGYLCYIADLKDQFKEDLARYCARADVRGEAADDDAEYKSGRRGRSGLRPPDGHCAGDGHGNEETLF